MSITALAVALLASSPGAPGPADGAGPDAAFLRAVALEAAGRPADALAALDQVGGGLPELADRIAFLRGRALEAIGRGEEAAGAYAEVPDTSVRAARARLARARLLAAQGRGGAALGALAPLLDLPPPPRPGAPDVPAAALLLAGRIHARGEPPDPAAARRVLLRCWADHPLAPEAPRCLSALRALPGADGAPPPEQVVRRAEVLLESSRAAAAARELREAMRRLPPADASEPVACRARLALGRALRAQRRDAAALGQLRPVADRCADAAVRAHALHLVAEALAARGARGEASAAYRRAAAEDPGGPLASRALFSAAELLALDGRDAEAAECFAQVARAAPGGELRDEARFRLAWLEKRAGRRDAAIAHLLALEEDARGRDSYEEARAAYWRARLLAGAGPDGRAEARAIWADLATRQPVGYYGVVARARLGEHGVEPPSPAAPPSPGGDAQLPGELLDDAHFRAAAALLRMGLRRAAAEELSAIDPARLGAGGGAPALVVAERLQRAGDAPAASLLLRTAGRGALRGAPRDGDLAAWRIAYPPAHGDEVRRWASQVDVSAELFHALIREESALDPRAVSPAGAVGLSQLLLPTARQVARTLRMRAPTRAALMAPATSIRIGTRYLAELLRRFGGSVPLALAAYNAGPTAVARWVEERGHLAVDEFVEEIPYGETRGYVKRVLRSFAAYRLLGGTDAGVPPGLHLELPELRRGVPAPAARAAAREGPPAPRRGRATADASTRGRP